MEGRVGKTRQGGRLLVLCARGGRQKEKSERSLTVVCKGNEDKAMVGKGFVWALRGRRILFGVGGGSRWRVSEASEFCLS